MPQAPGVLPGALPGAAPCPPPAETCCKASAPESLQSTCRITWVLQVGLPGATSEVNLVGFGGSRHAAPALGELSVGTQFRCRVMGVMWHRRGTVSPGGSAD